MAASGFSPSISQRTADESDLDPAAFLRSVRALSEKREREDAERYRKLEEEVERGRRQRAARRAERGESISPHKVDVLPRTPSKTSESAVNLASPPPTIPSHTPPMEAHRDAPQQSTSGVEDIPEFNGFGSAERKRMSTPTIQNPAQPSTLTPSTLQPPPSASSLARSGTLTWQRRPASRAGGVRPLSMAAVENNSQGRSAAADERELSREQIAASLGSRDPSWFRQTSDRGFGNAAYRKSQEEGSSRDSFGSGRRGLPGLSQGLRNDTMPVAETSPSEHSGRDAISRVSSVRDSGHALQNPALWSIRTPTASKPDLKALVAADQEQEKAAPTFAGTTSPTNGEQLVLDRSNSMSSSQARSGIAAERPASPTKGMGGFVQSAMMKRSDSVNKRWNAQPAASAERHNSVTNLRTGYGGLGELVASHSMPKLESTSHLKRSESLVSIQHTEGEVASAAASIPTHARSKSVASNYSTTVDEAQTSPPASPSKRWSPTKSSWLESAITKPDSPKPTPARNSQPSWMVDIAKAKAQKSDSTPDLIAQQSSRSNSPTKEMFGQGMLKRSESRDLSTSVGQISRTTSRPSSPSKALPEQTSLERSHSRSLASLSRSGTPDPRSTTKADRKSPGTLLDEPTSPPSKARSAGSTPDSSPLKTSRSKTPLAAAQTEAIVAAHVQPGNSEASPPTNFVAETSEQESIAPQQAESKISRASTKAPAALLGQVEQPSKLVKIKPETPPKPQTDFRSTLRSRPASEAKQEEAPEFLSKFGKLKKTQTQNYVAPDVLKDNILRGKGDLVKTDGPVKTQRRDELKESLLAKKGQWQKDKDEGIVHERKVSGPPPAPQKPEALAKREVLTRADNAKTPASPEKSKTATPEALARHKDLRMGSNSKVLDSQPPSGTSASAVASAQSAAPWVARPSAKLGTDTAVQPTAATKLASRFNPALAGVLARGPPSSSALSKVSPPVDLSETSSRGMALDMRTAGDPPASEGQLQDMRKGRAKGPKRRKEAVKDVENEISSTPAAVGSEPLLEPGQTQPKPCERDTPEVKTMESPPQLKPQAPPGSAASLMIASLNKTPASTPEPAGATHKDELAPQNPRSAAHHKFDVKRWQTPVALPARENTPPIATIQKPQTPAKDSVLTNARSNGESTIAPVVRSPQVNTIPVKISPFIPENRDTVTRPEDDKENTDSNAPSVKSAAMQWDNKTIPGKATPPTQILLPSRKDEEAAMRSAGLLARSPSRPASRDGLGISIEKSNASDAATSITAAQPTSAGIPPKPAKSSRAVSGQLREAASNNALPEANSYSHLQANHELPEMFRSLLSPQSQPSLDVRALISSTVHQDRVFKTVRKQVQVVRQDGSIQQVPQPEEYAFFDESVYICTHSYNVANGPKKTEVFLWTGVSSSTSAVQQAESAAKAIAKDSGNAFVHIMTQGLEPPGFLQALGGILVTRRGARESAPKQYVLCGRKHLGQIVFDEVDFTAASLCSGFVYLVSFPVTLQETRMYLWKGSACSADEISASRLAAMDLSETGEIIEVDDGAEFASFLKIFGPGTSKASIPKPSELWRQKALSPDTFAVRLFGIKPAETKTGGMFGNIFKRRPSSNNINKSPTRKREEDSKVEVKEISPFTQSDFDAEGVYLLDAHCELYVLVGPLLQSLPEGVRTSLLSETLLAAAEYASLAFAIDGRPARPKGVVVFSGVPGEVKKFFRHWDESRGLWGTAGLMAGSGSDASQEARTAMLDEVLGFAGKER